MESMTARESLMLNPERPWARPTSVPKKLSSQQDYLASSPAQMSLVARRSRLRLRSSAHALNQALNEYEEDNGTHHRFMILLPKKPTKDAKNPICTFVSMPFGQITTYLLV